MAYNMLLIDCGNTALKCQLDNQLRVFYLNSTQFKVEFKAYIGNIDCAIAVALSSVASPQTLHTIAAILNSHCTQPIKIATTKNSFATLKIGYQNSQQLGIDRWLALIATHHIKTNRIIIDAGSWLKMDVVLANGQHLGGVIISKSKHDENVLFNRFNLEQQKCTKTKSLFGTSTLQCLCLCFNQYGLHAVKAILTRWLLDLKQPCAIIISGGGAHDALRSIQQLKQCAQKYILDIKLKENLVLSGLSTLYNN